MEPSLDISLERVRQLTATWNEVLRDLEEQERRAKLELEALACRAVDAYRSLATVARTLEARLQTPISAAHIVAADHDVLENGARNVTKPAGESDSSTNNSPVSAPHQDVTDGWFLAEPDETTDSRLFLLRILSEHIIHGRAEVLLLSESAFSPRSPLSDVLDRMAALQLAAVHVAATQRAAANLILLNGTQVAIGESGGGSDGVGGACAVEAREAMQWARKTWQQLERFRDAMRSIAASSMLDALRVLNWPPVSTALPASVTIPVGTVNTNPVNSTVDAASMVLVTLQRWTVTWAAFLPTPPPSVAVVGVDPLSVPPPLLWAVQLIAKPLITRARTYVASLLVAADAADIGDGSVHAESLDGIAQRTVIDGDVARSLVGGNAVIPSAAWLRGLNPAYAAAFVAELAASSSSVWPSDTVSDAGTMPLHALMRLSDGALSIDESVRRGIAGSLIWWRALRDKHSAEVGARAVPVADSSNSGGYSTVPDGVRAVRWGGEADDDDEPLNDVTATSDAAHVDVKSLVLEAVAIDVARMCADVFTPAIQELYALDSGEFVGSSLRFSKRAIAAWRRIAGVGERPPLQLQQQVNGASRPASAPAPSSALLTLSRFWDEWVAVDVALAGPPAAGYDFSYDSVLDGSYGGYYVNGMPNPEVVSTPGVPNTDAPRFLQRFVWRPALALTMLSLVAPVPLNVPRATKVTADGTKASESSIPLSGPTIIRLAALVYADNAVLAERYRLAGISSQVMVAIGAQRIMSVAAPNSSRGTSPSGEPRPHGSGTPQCSEIAHLVVRHIREMESRYGGLTTPLYIAATGASATVMIAHVIGDCLGALRRTFVTLGVYVDSAPYGDDDDDVASDVGEPGDEDVNSWGGYRNRISKRSLSLPLAAELHPTGGGLRSGVTSFVAHKMRRFMQGAAGSPLGGPDFTATTTDVHGEDAEPEAPMSDDAIVLEASRLSTVTVEEVHDRFGDDTRDDEHDIADVLRFDTALVKAWVKLSQAALSGDANARIDASARGGRDWRGVLLRRQRVDASFVDPSGFGKPASALPFVAWCQALSVLCGTCALLDTLGLQVSSLSSSLAHARAVAEGNAPGMVLPPCLLAPPLAVIASARRRLVTAVVDGIVAGFETAAAPWLRLSNVWALREYDDDDAPFFAASIAESALACAVDGVCAALSAVAREAGCSLPHVGNSSSDDQCLWGNDIMPILTARLDGVIFSAVVRRGVSGSGKSMDASTRMYAAGRRAQHHATTAHRLSQPDGAAPSIFAMTSMQRSSLPRIPTAACLLLRHRGSFTDQMKRLAFALGAGASAPLTQAQQHVAEVSQWWAGPAHAVLPGVCSLAHLVALFTNERADAIRLALATLLHERQGGDNDVGSDSSRVGITGMPTVHDIEHARDMLIAAAAVSDLETPSDTLFADKGARLDGSQSHETVLLLSPLLDDECIAACVQLLGIPAAAAAALVRGNVATTTHTNS